MNRQCSLTMCYFYYAILKSLAAEKTDIQWTRMSQCNMSIKSSQQNESFQMSLKQGGLTLVYCSNMFPNKIWCYLPVQEQTVVVLHIV